MRRKSTGVPGPAVVLAGLLLLAPATAAAQADLTGPRLLRLPASTRALGLGDVHPLGSTDSDALFYHAGFADRLRGASLGVQWYGGRSTLYTASAATEWWGGALALGLRSVEYATALNLIPDSILAAGSESLLLEDGEAQVSERAASVAYARRVKGVRGGVTAHLIEQRVAGERNTMVAGDIAFGTELRPVAIGIAARNLGMSYELNGRSVELPALVMLSAALTRVWTPGPLDVLPAAAVTYEFTGELVPAAGVEVSYWPLSGRTFSLRLGARRAPEGTRPFTLGAGFTGDRLILDYALVPFDGDRYAHRFGMRWR